MGNNPGFTGRWQLEGKKALPKDQLLPHPHFQAGENSRFKFEGFPSTAKTEPHPQGPLDQQTFDLGEYCPWEAPVKRLKRSRRAGNELRKAAKNQEVAAKRPDLTVQVDPSLLATMTFEEYNTQATQEYTDPRRLGLHASGISEDDAADIICILHPSTPAAHDAVAATIEQNPRHIIPNADLIAKDGESLFDPAAKVQPSSREIALRLSSQVKNLETGFTFGRTPAMSDVLLTKDRSDTIISGRHFRIYYTKDGVLMLQDTSKNGTLIDDSHLVWRPTKATDASSRMLQNGSIICVVDRDGNQIKFHIRVPNRGDQQEAYNANLARYVSALPGPKSKIVLSGSEHPFGMRWNGGSVYNVIGCLGKGAFATVYKLATKNDGHVYAAKELDKRRFLKQGNPDVKFDNEIRIMKDLRHPNIVQYEDYHDHGDWAYIIMEIITGGELSTYMHKNGPVAEPMAQTITRQILHALAYLHARGITHRDIKPDNILISETDPLLVKLSDFGLSKCIANQETFLKTFCGTLLYCAPEIYPRYGDYENVGAKKRHRPSNLSPKRYSDRVDMWSFGAVLFHVLCNKPPVICDGNDKAAQMLTNIMTEDINFDPLYAVDVSEEAVDFVSCLLKRNPVLRPTPKLCFQHAWIAEVADLVDYMDLDDEMPSYRGQGLATVEEAEEELLTRSDDAAYDQIFGPTGALSFGYLKTAGERISKRQRISPKAKTGATGQCSNEVAYPQLPQVSNLTGAPAGDARGERLFGEITSTALQSSGVFTGKAPPVSVPTLQQRVEEISVNDFVTSETKEPPPSTGEASEQQLQYPQTLGIPGALPNPAPSLLGAEAQIGQLNMASPEAGQSERTTPDTLNPLTPETQAPTPAPTQEEKTGTTGSGQPGSKVAEEPIFSRYIDLKIPESLAHDTEFVKAFNARQAEAKERRARRAKMASAVDRAKQGPQGLNWTIDARTGKEVEYGSINAQKTDQRFSRKIDLPTLESLNPISNRRFGKLTTVPGSYTDVTFWITSRMTSWGRSLACSIPFEDRTDTRIPLYAIEITYHAPDMEARIERGQAWETTPGIHTVVSTGGSECIWVNDVELRKESLTERCAYYGKIYTGDIITVFRSPDPKGPFLKFRVQMHYGDSARFRPEKEKGFQVRKETVHYRREKKRIESMKANRKETTASDSASKAT